ncbi:MAG: deoxyguanosinetriphosphate triphosphohydrolase family protein [Gammaproteobacteria bacterium]|nr:deoxyguanosinetriphosphate triphosphohydrolase family protein [Gammaproteobacteria bacterium]
MSVWTERLSGENKQRPNDHRNPYQRDKARILHSAAFRRLQSKTQILSVGQNDFYRTRLTHSLEVAQIGTGLTAQLRQNQQVLSSQTLIDLIPSDALIESLCLAHDLGHPSFGHGGEIALNYMMRNSGGFEANGQTFRIITLLEPYTEHYGMDLTRRSTLGLIKYPQFIETRSQDTAANHPNYLIKADDWKPTKGLFSDDKLCFEWVIKPLSEQDKSLFLTSQNNKTKFKSFDASIMELADDIAYGVHDLEDAIVLDNVKKEQWFEQALPQLQKIDNLWSKKYSQQLSDMLFSDQHHQRKSAIGALVNHLITNIKVVEQPEFSEPLLKYNTKLSESSAPLLNILKSFVYNNVIMAPEIQQIEFKGQRMLMTMFDAFKTDPLRLLPLPVGQLWQLTMSQQGNADRILCDYLASMSDEQATKTYNTLFNSYS